MVTMYRDTLETYYNEANGPRRIDVRPIHHPHCGFVPPLLAKS